jgi:hypothetical protein
MPESKKKLKGKKKLKKMGGSVKSMKSSLPKL